MCDVRGPFPATAMKGDRGRQDSDDETVRGAGGQEMVQAEAGADVTRRRYDGRPASALSATR